MKSIYTVFIYFLFFPVIAQQFSWGISGISGGSDFGSDIVADLNGDIIVAGKCEQAFELAGNNLTSTGKNFIAKFRNNKQLKWIRGLDISVSDQCRVGVDANGNIYFAGSCKSGTLTGGDYSQTIVTKDFCDVLVAKYSPDGTLMWCKSFGFENSLDFVKSIKTDANGNIYIGGISDQLTSHLYKHFILKYDSAGNEIWRNVSEWSDNLVSVESLALDTMGNIYVTGYFSDTADFVNNKLFSSGLSSRIFVVKYDTEGGILWAKAKGNNNSWAYTLAVSETGEVYIGGTFNSPCIFGATELKQAIGGAMLCALDCNGNDLWAKASGAQRISAIVIDSSSEIFVAGRMKNNVSFGYGNSMIQLNSNKPNGEMFVAKYKGDGDLKWVIQPTGSNQPDEVNNASAICVAKNERVYLTGSYSGLTIFGSDSLLANRIGLSARNFFFVAEIVNKQDSKHIEEPVYKDLQVFPNPTKGLFEIQFTSASKFEQLQLSITDSRGREVLFKSFKLNSNEFSQQINLSAHPPGVYFVKVMCGDVVEVRKVVVQ